MNHIRGPFIEYDCVKCGRPVQENASRKNDRLLERVAEANAKPETRVCASCSITPT